MTRRYSAERSGTTAGASLGTGRPGHHTWWCSAQNNRLCKSFFQRQHVACTRQTMDSRLSIDSHCTGRLRTSYVNCARRMQSNTPDWCRQHEPYDWIASMGGRVYRNRKGLKKRRRIIRNLTPCFWCQTQKQDLLGETCTTCTRTQWPVNGIVRYSRNEWTNAGEVDKIEPCSSREMSVLTYTTTHKWFRQRVFVRCKKRDRKW